MLNRKIVIAIALIATLTATFVVSPARAWVGPPYSGPGSMPTPTEDYDFYRRGFEMFGPRVDYTLFKFYGSDAAEYAALTMGEIDIMDRQLTATEYAAVSSGSVPDVALANNTQLDMYVLDIRNNEWINDGPGDPDHIGNEDPSFPDPTDTPNPFGDQTLIFWPGDPELPTGVVSRGSQARRALAHLVDRSAIISLVGGFYNPIYTHIPDIKTLFSFNWINWNAMQYSFDPSFAAQILDMAGYVDVDGDGIRNFDSNYDGMIVLGDANFVVDFWTGTDLFRKTLGDWITDRLSGPGGTGMNLADYGPIIGVNRIPFVDGQAEFFVKRIKVGHLLTGYHTLSRELTTHFWLYDTKQYWHPGVPPNYMRVSDPLLDYYAEQTAYAPSEGVARGSSWSAQARMNDPDFVGNIPIANSAGGKAYYKWYDFPTNTEYWRGFVNSADQGVNTGSPVDGRTGTSGIDTLLNAHGDNNPTGGTLRYGWRYTDKPFSLNPFLYETFHDAEIIFRTYTGLVAVNPYDPAPSYYLSTFMFPRMGDVPWQAYAWNIDQSGPTTKITFKLREDIYFHDGTQMTAKDVYYTVQFAHFLATNWPAYGWTARRPTWWGKVMDLTPEFDPLNPTLVTDVMGVGVDMPDGPLGFKVVFNYNVQSIWAFWWAGGIPIVPKHKWWNLFVPDPTGSDGFAPDPQMIGTGAFQVYPGSMDPPDGVHYDPTLGFIRLDKNPTFFASYNPTFHGSSTSSSITPGVTVTIDPSGWVRFDNPTGTPYKLKVTFMLPGWSTTITVKNIKTPANGFGVTKIQLWQAFWGYYIAAFVWIDGAGYVWTIGGLIVNPYPPSVVVGDFAGSTGWPPSPPDGRVDYRDLFWFLKMYGQEAYLDP